MLSRKLFCVEDPAHASYVWAVESRFFHSRAFDPCGQTLSQTTLPVAETEPGAVQCAVCGGQVFVAGRPAAAGRTVACDILGQCRTQPADANLACLVALADRLARIDAPSERQRLAPVVGALLTAVADDPAARAVLEARRLADLFSLGK